MKMEKIKLFDVNCGKKEEKEIVDVMRSGYWASGSGNGKVNIFEKKFSKFIGCNSCVAVNSGTAALHLALSLFDLKGKEVILPSLSFVSTAHSIIYNGGKPIFVDIDPQTLCMDSEKIKSVITKKTKIILPVHFGGMPCNMSSISKIAKKHNLQIIEDAAHSVGTIFQNKFIGNHNNICCFSFHPVKNLAMITGGAISVPKKYQKFYERLKSQRWCGISSRKGVYYDVDKLGWNYYMNEFSAAIGISQLSKLKALNNKKKKIAKKYFKKLNVKDKMPFSKDCSYHLYWIQVEDRDNFLKKMNLMGIETGIHYKPIHTMTFYKSKKSLPITEKISKKIVSIPIHSNLTDENVERIIKAVNSSI
jgi:perosamine synthetase